MAGSCLPLLSTRKDQQWADALARAGALALEFMAFSALSGFPAHALVDCADPRLCAQGSRNGSVRAAFSSLWVWGNRHLCKGSARCQSAWRRGAIRSPWAQQSTWPCRSWISAGTTWWRRCGTSSDPTRTLREGSDHSGSVRNSRESESLPLEIRKP